MSDVIRLTARVPIAITGRDNAQLANENDVYTWDADTAQYGPAQPMDRLITHDTGAGDFEFVFFSDGSPIWY